MYGVMLYNTVMKTHVSYRLSEEAIRLLRLLAEAKGISMASALEIAIRDLAKRESLK
jgi:pentatricopeptide repeat protein